jgi:hypothetical protein
MDLNTLFNVGPFYVLTLFFWGLTMKLFKKDHKNWIFIAVSTICGVIAGMKLNFLCSELNFYIKLILDIPFLIIAILNFKK